MKKIIVFLLFILITNFLYANEQFTQKDLEDASYIYGFYIGQNYSLDMISAKYPNLKNQVTIAKMNFDNKFGKTINNIDQIFNKLDKSKWEETKRKIVATIKQKFSTYDISEKEALDAIKKLRDRANGKMELSVLKKFLIFNPEYKNNPAMEFIDGYTYTYENDGSGKARGIPFKIKVPLSWKAENGRRPHIVQKFTKVEHGVEGSAIFMVLINDDEPYDGKITKADIDHLISSEDIKSFLPDNGTLLGKGYLQLERQHGFWIRCRTEAFRMKNKVLLDFIMYNIFYKGKLISLQGMVINKVNDKSVNHFKKFESLFELIANTLLLPDIYK